MKANLLCAFLTLILVNLHAQKNYSFQYEIVNPKVKVKSFVDFEYNDNYFHSKRSGLNASMVLNFKDKIIDTKNNICVFTPIDAKKKWYVIEDLDTIFGKQSVIQKSNEKLRIDNYDCEKYTSTYDFSGLKFIYSIWTTKKEVIDTIYNRYIIAIVTDGRVNANIGFPVKFEMNIYNQNGTKVIQQGIYSLINLNDKKLADVKLPWLDSEYSAGISTGTSSNYGTSKSPSSSSDFRPAVSSDLNSSHGATTSNNLSYGSSSTEIFCPWSDEMGSIYENRLRQLVLRVTGKEITKFSKVYGVSLF
jgi:hypothetical protein